MTPDPSTPPFRDNDRVTTVSSELARPRPATGRHMSAALARNVNLTRELALTQFKLKYAGSALGYVWSLVKPMMLFGVLYVIFERLMHTGTGENFPMQLLLGIVVWTFFAETTGAAVSVVASNGSLIKKASFPRPILVIAATVASSMSFLINVVLVMVVGIAFQQMQLGWHSLLAIPLLVELYVLVIGLSLFLSALFVFYRDLGHIWEISVQMLFWGSAIFFTLSGPTVAKYVKIIGLNPMAQIIEDLRHALVTTTVPWTASLLEDQWLIIVPFALVGISLALGMFVFRRLEPRFAEYL